MEREFPIAIYTFELKSYLDNNYKQCTEIYPDMLGVDSETTQRLCLSDTFNYDENPYDAT